MTSTTDIGNRALQLLGTRTSMSSLNELSNEAVQTTIAIGPIQNWSFGLANWNFARKTAVLSVAKGPPPTSSTPWSSTYPPPPWLYEYTLPDDFIRAIYVTNNDYNATNTGWLGEPKRFQMATDTVSSAQQEVLLTNATPTNLIYTSFVTDPTLWPWYFERLCVIALAQCLCMVLTGDKKLFEELTSILEQQISIAIQMNTIEGLIIDDTTPEWIQALGINYPFRRVSSPPPGAAERAEAASSKRRGG